MEKVLALIFSFIVFVIGLAFLITGRAAVGLLLIAVSLFLVFLAFRRKDTVVVAAEDRHRRRDRLPAAQMPELRRRTATKMPWK